MMTTTAEDELQLQHPTICGSALLDGQTKSMDKQYSTIFIHASSSPFSFGRVPFHFCLITCLSSLVYLYVLAHLRSVGFFCYVFAILYLILIFMMVLRT